MAPARRIANRYRIVAEVARGGMGVVYEAFDELRNVRLALKQLHTTARSPRIVAFFEREYQTLVGLIHPRIIRVYDYGVADGLPYYTMELLEGGQDVHARCPMPYREACAVLRDVATSLALVHARGFVHRDVTPRNVHVTADGHGKLLDFGTLEAFGITHEVLGTPPFIAPEMLRAERLDQRSDLFSLGALAYYMLTGQHAFPARRFEDLYDLWTERPVAPSSVTPSVPLELDQLVLGLLSTDPQARPFQAAEVIERLNLIGELPEEAESDSRAFARAYLTNVRLSGCDDALARAAGVLDASAQGQLKSALVVGESGMGRTRMLAEIATKAQLSGATAVRVDAIQATPFATAQALLTALQDSLPAGASEALGAEPAVPVGVLPRAASEAGERGRPQPAPGQRSDELHAALLQALGNLGSNATLMLGVDNIERADEQSITLLAALRDAYPSARISVFATLNPTDARAASAPLKALSSQSELIALEPLGHDTMTDLLRSVFGEAPNLVRCSEWILDATAGRPLHCIELVNSLFEHGAIRFSGGAWTLPAERPELVLSQDLFASLRVRLGTLTPSARELAELLSIFDGAVTFELCVALSLRLDENAYALVDQLTRAFVLTVDGPRCRFANDAVRRVFIEGMDPVQRKHRHREVGELLAERANGSPLALMQAGSQLMDGGELSRGAACVARATEQDIEQVQEFVHLAAPMLARAYEIYEAEGRSIYERFMLLMGLAHAGFHADWRHAQRHGAKAIAIAEDALGLRTARMLRPYLGKKLAISIALAVAAVRFMLTKPKHLTFGFERMIEVGVGSIGGLVAAGAVTFDRRMVELAMVPIETLSWLGDKTALECLYRMNKAVKRSLEDEPTAVCEGLEQALLPFRDPNNYLEIQPLARNLFTGGALFGLGFYQVLKGTDEALLTAKEIENSGFALHRMFAAQIRVAYHASRGELAAASQYRRTVEVHAVHVGSAWQGEIIESANSLAVYALSGDVVNTRRVVEHFEDLSRGIPSFSHMASQAHAALALARSDYGMARKLYEQVLEGRAPRSFPGWLVVRGMYAAALNGRGAYAEAKAVCQQTFEHMTAADAEFPFYVLWVQLELAFAEAGLGDVTNAAQRLDALVAEGVGGLNPFLRGSVHRMRARVALVAEDRVAFEHHSTQTEHWFLPTANPALAARCEELRLLALGAPWHKPVERGRTASASLAQLLKETDVGEREMAALHAILRMSKAQRGMLFRVVDDVVEMSVRIGEHEPPESVIERVRALIAELETEAKTSTLDDSYDSSGGPTTAISGYRVLPLAIEREARLVVFGAVALAEAPELRPPNVVELAQLARVLLDGLPTLRS